jgi:hypothetical protein
MTSFVNGLILHSKVTPAKVDFKPHIAYIWHSNFDKKKLIIVKKEGFTLNGNS